MSTELISIDNTLMIIAGSCVLSAIMNAMFLAVVYGELRTLVTLAKKNWDKGSNHSNDI